MFIPRHPQRAAVLLLAACALAPLSAPAAEPVPPGTVVVLQFQEAVSSKTAKKGDLIKLRVYANVVSRGETLIKQDTVAEGRVTAVRQPRRFGRGAELKIQLENVTDVEGNRVALRPYTSGERFEASGPGAAGAGFLVLGPVGLVGGAFVKGRHVTIDSGTRIQALVEGDEPEPRPKGKNDFPPIEPK